MSWIPRTRRWSRIGSLCQLLHEVQGSLAHGPSLLCSHACAAETRPAHLRSLQQDRCAWSHLLHAVPVLLSHHWLLICSRVACCLARALACGIEPSRPLAKHFRSHSRTRRFNSARTSGSCNSTVHSTCCDVIRVDLPLPPVLRCASNPRRVTPAPTASCRCIASPSAFAAPYLPPLPPRGLWSACIRVVPSTVVRARPPPFSTSSSQCRLTSSAAFSSMVSDVLHARLHCFPRAGPRRVAAPRHREP
jgi:hypothetical protein